MQDYRPIKFWQTLIRCSFCLPLILLLLSLDCFNLREFLFSLSLKTRVMPWLREGCWSWRNTTVGWVWKEIKIVLKLLYRGHEHNRAIKKFFQADNTGLFISFHYTLEMNCFWWTGTTPSIPELIWVKNVRAIVVCGFLMKFLKKHILKIWKKSWVPFGSYLLNNTSNSAQFEWKWAGLAVLFSR